MSSVSLGIDAGGTYTDLVLLDREARAVMQAVKSPTSRPDPSRGIREGLRLLDPKVLQKVSMASLATSFATNAIVEDVGAEAGLVLIGYDRIPPAIPPFTRVLMLCGGHTVSGKEKAPLDLERLEQELPRFVQGLDAVAVTGFFSVRNPDHETRVSHIIRQRFGLPVVRGHRLSTRLDALKRATTAWWNARLIPLISNLIKACQAVLEEADVWAPLMVVRGDGTLMSAAAALERPVDTLLSGPAASILGSRYLSGVQDCLIVDMGGTTTDMALMSGGRVVVDPDGAKVGRWETHVEAARVRTIGLGGDSLIGMGVGQNIEVGPRRVVPLCVQAEQRPEMIELLRKVLVLVSAGRSRSINPSGFYCRTSDAEVGITSEYLLWTDAEAWPRALDLAREERDGSLVRSALTPTDLRVAAGDFALGEPEAARLGRAILARYLGMSEEALSASVEEIVSRRLCTEAASFISSKDEAALITLADRWYPFPRELSGQVGFTLRLTLNMPVVGVGAPAPSCVPRAFRHLGAEVILPERYDVSVAVGAVVGLVDMTMTAIVRPNEAGAFDLFTPTKSTFLHLEDAVRAGKTDLEAQAREEMTRNYVASPLLDLKVEDRKVRSSTGEEVHLETVITLRASGRPAVDDHRAYAPDAQGSVALSVGVTEGGAK